VARTTLGGEFCTSFVDRNRNFKNAPNLVLGQTGWIGCVRFEKINCKFFLLQSCRNGPRGRVSHEFCRPKPKLRKRTKHECWVKRGESGAFISKKSIASFFASIVAGTALVSGFRTSFVDRNRNFDNAPNKSFGSNGVNRVPSF
jgi:hypothetical protein